MEYVVYLVVHFQQCDVGLCVLVLDAPDVLGFSPAQESGLVAHAELGDAESTSVCESHSVVAHRVRLTFMKRVST
jgi:hypothetical protein